MLLTAPDQLLAELRTVIAPERVLTDPDVEWNEGIPHWTPITRDCPEHQEDDQ